MQETCHQELFLESLAGKDIGQLELPAWLNPIARNLFICSEGDQKQSHHFSQSVLLDVSLIAAINSAATAAGELPMSSLRYFAGAVSCLSKASLSLKLLLRSNPSMRTSCDEMTKISQKAISVQAEKTSLVNLNTQMQDVVSMTKANSFDLNALVPLANYHDVTGDKLEDEFRLELAVVHGSASVLQELIDTTSNTEVPQLVSWLNKTLASSSSELPSLPADLNVSKLAFVCKLNACLGPIPLKTTFDMLSGLLLSFATSLAPTTTEAHISLKDHATTLLQNMNLQKISSEIASTAPQDPWAAAVASMCLFADWYQQAIYRAVRHAAIQEWRETQSLKTVDIEEVHQSLPAISNTVSLVNTFHKVSMPPRVDDATVLTDLSVYLQWQDLVAPALQHSHSDLEAFKNDFPDIHLTYTTAVDGFRDALASYTSAFEKAIESLSGQVSTKGVYKQAIVDWKFEAVEDQLGDEKKLTKMTQELQSQIDLVANQSRITRELLAKGLTFPSMFKDLLSKLPQEAAFQDHQFTNKFQH